jgi:bacteriocin-like protein
METMNLTYLSKDELKEISGGMPLLIISLLMPSVKRMMDFVDGVREGYRRGTATN